MNFLQHRALAEADLGSALAGVGAMLPDLWRMVDRRVRPLPAGGAEPVRPGGAVAELVAGVEHHLSIDRWFHDSEVFREGERRMAEALRGARLEAPRMALFAHVAWELCLDGALLRRDGLERVLESLRESLAPARGEPASRAAEALYFDRSTQRAHEPGERAAFHRHMERVFDELCRGPWLERYLDGEGLAEVLGHVRERVGLSKLGASDRSALAAALEPMLEEAGRALARL